MKKNAFLLLGLLVPALFAAKVIKPASGKPLQAKQADNRPNIVVIMADDLDSRQLSCYGGKNLKTTNIDRLAAEGLKFNQIIASEAMCVPIRASLYTGLYPMHHGSYQNHRPVYNDRNLKSVCQYLGDQGYEVALTGKNHSTTPHTVFPFRFIKGFQPNCVSTNDDYFLDSVKTFVSNRSKPFCLFVMSINPHAPWVSGDPTEFDPNKLVLPPNWVDTKASREIFCKYLGEVRRLDNQVGDVMKTLKETGQDKNTMVIFLGEQGPQFPGAKWNLWDYGQKSSMIARFPGKIKAGAETSALVQYEDITPTLIDFVGGKPIAGLDGRSFLQVLYGKTDHARDYAYGIHNNFPEGPPYAIRSVRDDNYKLILNLSSPSKYYNKYMMNPENKNSVWYSWLEHSGDNEHNKFIVDRITTRPAVALYDIKADPYELNNLADQPKYKDLVAKYTAKVREWMKEENDKGVAEDVPFAREGGPKMGKKKKGNRNNVN